VKDWQYAQDYLTIIGRHNVYFNSPLLPSASPSQDKPILEKPEKW
jgi:hypothetical protein